MKKTIVCIDRDGTLIYDEKDHLYLGRDDDWKSKVKMLPYVIDGFTLLKNIPGSALYMITNQPGVAISDYPLLTLERAHEVCTHVVGELRGMGARIDGYFLCPHATPDYVKTKPGVNFDEKLVHECRCLKPALGMVFDALKAENITPDDANVYVIGDRATDVQTALNTNGIGILVPFENEPGEDEKVKNSKTKHASILPMTCSMPRNLSLQGKSEFPPIIVGFCVFPAFMAKQWLERLKATAWEQLRAKIRHEQGERQVFGKR